MNFISAPTATMVSKYWAQEGKPIFTMLPMCLAVYRMLPGRSDTTELPRLLKMQKSRNNVPMPLEMAVASPAPRAPNPKNCGSTNSGSRAMLIRPPRDTPADAIPALPSARKRFASKMLMMAQGPPQITTHLA